MTFRLERNPRARAAAGHGHGQAGDRARRHTGRRATSARPWCQRDGLPGWTESGRAPGDRYCFHWTVGPGRAHAGAGPGCRSVEAPRLAGGFARALRLLCGAMCRLSVDVVVHLRWLPYCLPPHKTMGFRGPAPLAFRGHTGCRVHIPLFQIPSSQ